LVRHRGSVEEGLSGCACRGPGAGVGENRAGQAGGSGKQAKQGRDQGRPSDVVRGSRWWMVDGARATGDGRTGGSRVVVFARVTSRESRIDQWPLLRRWRQSERWKGGRATGSRRGRGRDAICAWVGGALQLFRRTTDSFHWTGLAVSTAAWRPELLSSLLVSFSRCF
jgi:hypothetical protein